MFEPLHRLAALACLLGSTTGLALAGAPAPFAWRSVNTQGMGYVSGLVVSTLPPYDLYARTDVGGAYRFDRAAQRWIPLLDGFGVTSAQTFSVVSIQVDPVDPYTVYVAAPAGHILNSDGSVTYPCEVWVSHNRGASWTALGLAAQKLYAGGNDSYRGTTGERLAIDPQQSTTIYFGSRANGLWRGLVQANGTAQWTQVSGGLPTPKAASDGTNVGFSFVVFDKSGGVTASGATKNIYAGVFGSGVWASQDGGATWSDTKSKASVLYYGDSPLRAAVDTDATLYVTFGGSEGAANGDVGRYQKGAWTSMASAMAPKAPYGPGFAGVNVDPTAPGTLVVTRASGTANSASSGSAFRSIDHGTTWKLIQPANPTLANQPAYYASGPLNWTAAIVIDPQNPKRVWQSNGYGVTASEDVDHSQPGVELANVWDGRALRAEGVRAAGGHDPRHERARRGSLQRGDGHGGEPLRQPRWGADHDHRPLPVGRAGHEYLLLRYAARQRGVRRLG